MASPDGGSSITTRPSTFARFPIPRAIFNCASIAFALLAWPNSARLLSPMLAASNKTGLSLVTHLHWRE